MKNKERKLAKGIDTPYRARAFSEKVYGGPAENPREIWKEMLEVPKNYYPGPSKYHVYYGELHGHTRLSDGRPTPDEYFQNIRDVAKLDFAALTDHDHGGVGKAELWGEKWEITKQKVAEYNEPHKFTTILAYERDSYPWYNNLVIYYNHYDGEMVREEIDGELSMEKLSELLKRDDIILVPHDTYHLDSGADFNRIPPELYPPMIEIYSRGDSAEYFGNPYNIMDIQCEGGYWQDALKRGGKMGCIAGSDDHGCKNGLIDSETYGDDNIQKYPGITGVLAESNTLPDIFNAIKMRRTFAFMGGRMEIDFRINGHYMGEEFAEERERGIYLKVTADADIKRITIVKNCRDYIFMTRTEQFLYDNRIETDCDFYYLRVETVDGRCGWTSPIWIHSK